MISRGMYYSLLISISGTNKNRGLESLPAKIDGVTIMRTGPKPVCNCGECRICKQRYYRWNHNLKKHINKPPPYVKNLHERGCYRTATTLEMVANGELLPIGEACKMLDKEFPWLQGVTLK